MKSCVFPGSFDPVTKGHMDLIARGASIFDHVTVTVMNNIRKSGAIPADLRVELLRKACRELPNVSVEKWDGLLAEYMRNKNERIVLRGIRGADDLTEEMHSFEANRMLYEDIETVLLPCSRSVAGISSSAVREIAAFGGSVRKFVPDELTEEITFLLSKH